MLRTVSFCVALVISVPLTTFGAEKGSHSATPLADAVRAAAANTAAPPLPAWALDRPDHRPAAVTALYGSYAALQVLDLVTTRKALSAGATEANPIMNTGGAAQIAAKVAGSAATVYFAERAWKKNRAGAIVLMAVINGATAAVVARNAQHARR